MKTKTYTVDSETGAVSLVGPFSHGLGAVEVKANTKSEATAKLLARYARQQRAGGPRLFIRNGAYCLASHDGESWGVETGTCHPRRAMACDGSQFPLCSGGGQETLKQAVAQSSFDYYAGDEFQAHERAHYGALGSVEADLLATLKALSAAVGAIPASDAARLGLVMPHAHAIALLGKLTGSKVPAGQSPVESLATVQTL